MDGRGIYTKTPMKNHKLAEKSHFFKSSQNDRFWPKCEGLGFQLRNSSIFRNRQYQILDSFQRVED